SGAFGSGLGNYTISYLNGALTVTPAVLTARLIGNVAKVYDTTTAASLAAGNYTLVGIVNGDDVGLNNPTSGLYGSANVGTGIPVSVSGLALTGSTAGNYILANNLVSADIGAISPALLTPG